METFKHEVRSPGSFLQRGLYHCRQSGGMLPNIFSEALFLHHLRLTICGIIMSYPFQDANTLQALNLIVSAAHDFGIEELGAMGTTILLLVLKFKS